jgi:hypothetical protein
MEPKPLPLFRSGFAATNSVRKKLAVFFLIILSLPAAYKVGFYTFYQLSKDYIAENYCVNKDRPITMCYGKCFLEKGLELADPTPNPDTLLAQLRFEISAFVVDNFAFTSSPSEPRLIFSITPAPVLSNGVSAIIFRPPLA